MEQRVRKVQVLKHPNGKSPYWYLRWWELTPDESKWKERWQSTKTTVKKDAQRQRRELERDLDLGRRAESEITWEDFVIEFIRKQTSRKPRTTLGLYEHSLNAFTKAVKPRYLAKVTHAVLEDFVDRRLRDGKAVATVNRDLRHVRLALHWAKRRGYISQVPDFKNVFVREDRKQPTIMPEEDFLAIVRILRSPELKLTKRSPDWWRVFFLYCLLPGTSSRRNPWTDLGMGRL